MVHVILAGFARAEDVLTWVIDLNAGSAGLPWVLPALNGEHGARTASRCARVSTGSPAPTTRP